MPEHSQWASDALWTSNTHWVDGRSVPPFPICKIFFNLVKMWHCFLCHNFFSTTVLENKRYSNSFRVKFTNFLQFLEFSQTNSIRVKHHQQVSYLGRSFKRVMVLISDLSFLFCFYFCFVFKIMMSDPANSRLDFLLFCILHTR